MKAKGYVRTRRDMIRPISDVDGVHETRIVDVVKYEDFTMQNHIII